MRVVCIHMVQRDIAGMQGLEVTSVNTCDLIKAIASIEIIHVEEIIHIEASLLNYSRDCYSYKQRAIDAVAHFICAFQLSAHVCGDGLPT